MRRILLALIAVMLFTSTAHAEETSQARRLLDEARLLDRNYKSDAANQIMWHVFLKGESLGASQMEIAEAANMLARFGGGAKDDKEEKYLLTWAAEAGYPPAMASLGTKILWDLERSETIEARLKEIVEYPRLFNETHAVEFIQEAAEKGNPSALDQLAKFHHAGKHGFLADPFRAEELEDEALRRRIEIGQTGDHHALITAASRISNREKSNKNSEEFIKEAIEIGMSQPGGMDSLGASRLAGYYSAFFLKDDADAQAQEYRWLLYASYRMPERLQGHYLSKLGDYFLGHESIIGKKYQNPIDKVAAHAILNVIVSQGTLSSVEKDKRDEIAKDMSQAEMKLAVELARICMDSVYKGCLDAVNQHFSLSNS